MTYGSMPMSVSRVTVDGASSVCSVERTRWPVCAACIAIFAVSWSRISPTSTTSGSWRRIARSALANVSFAFSLTCVWLTPGIWYSIGSSIVMMFVRPDLIEVIAELSVVVLPLPVGPTTRIMPCWWRRKYRTSSIDAADSPSSSSGGAPLR